MTALALVRGEERLFDRVLDRAVVPGYSRIGYLARKGHWGSSDPAPGSMAGKRVLVSGANSGLGKAAALEFARLGATVHLVVRDAGRGEAALTEIREAVPGAELCVDLCDFSDLDDVRRAATGLAGRLDRIDVLVHNAGALPAERTLSPQGHELTVAIHVLGPILFTDLLLPALTGNDARVIVVTSGGMYTQKLPVDDPEFERGQYQGAVAYARSKRMQVALRGRLQERWADAGVAVHTMHPGWADTPGVAASLPLFRLLTRPVLRTAAEGADTIVWLGATRPPLLGGGFWHDRALRPDHYRASTRESAEDVEQMYAWVEEQLA